MANILIVAEGKIAQSFLDTIETKSLKIHNYVVVVKNRDEFQTKSNYIEFIELDATSIYRLKEVCSEDRFKTVFIVKEDTQEAVEVYKNIRMLNKKVRVVVLDYDGYFKEFEDSNLNIVDVGVIVSNRLYDFLPNVPVTAKTIGLNEGEIMEVSVPFSSPFAFRHVGSIPQRKWKVVGIYRDNKLLLPTNATMIRPRDRLLIVGKPQVLSSIYKKISSSHNNFPEPFGKNFYLYLDLDKDAQNAINYLEEAIYLVDKSDNKCLIVRVVNPNDFKIVNSLKNLERDNVRFYISYDEFTRNEFEMDILEYEIGLILLSTESLVDKTRATQLQAFKKLIYVFGKNKLSNVKEAVVVKSDSSVLEEISSIVFYIAETLGVKLSLREYDPDGKFSGSEEFVEHYETLAQVHNTKLEIIKRKKNPIKAIRSSKDILLVIPFKKDMKLNGFLSFLKRDVDSLLIRTNKHPKLLIPIE